MYVKNNNKIVCGEFCGSVHGYLGNVERFEEVQLVGYNENGEPIEKNFKGWNARIAQHEFDHLNGRIYVDIMVPGTFAFNNWKKYNVQRLKKTSFLRAIFSKLGIFFKGCNIVVVFGVSVCFLFLVRGMVANEETHLAVKSILK